MIARLTKSVTAARFARDYADEPFCELERGEVIYLTAAGWDHSRIVIRIAFILQSWAAKSKRGRVLGGEAGVITERHPDTVRGIDVAYVSYRRVPKGTRYDGFLTTPPDLAVEVIGKGQGWGKMTEKAGEYFSMGVTRVWIVDPKRQKVHVFRPNGEPTQYELADVIRDREVLPGFSCKVSRFFED